MPTNNSWNSNIPVSIAKGGTNSTSMTNTDGVCYFDGTSIVTTAVGTATDVLTSNGAGVAPTFQPLSTQTIYSVKTQVTSQQIKNLHASPIVLVSAAGADKLFYVIGAFAKFVYGGSNVFTAAASQTIGLYYGGLTLSPLTTDLVTNGSITNVASKFSIIPQSQKPSQNVGLMDNVNLVIYNPIATEISGNASNDNYVIVQVLYCISDTLTP